LILIGFSNKERTDPSQSYAPRMELRRRERPTFAKATARQA
jgi:hypothetical protein